jgi:hypothetical protein
MSLVEEEGQRRNSGPCRSSRRQKKRCTPTRKPAANSSNPRPRLSVRRDNLQSTWTTHPGPVLGCSHEAMWMWIGQCATRSTLQRARFSASRRGFAAASASSRRPAFHGLSVREAVDCRGHHPTRPVVGSSFVHTEYIIVSMGEWFLTAGRSKREDASRQPRMRQMHERARRSHRCTRIGWAAHGGQEKRGARHDANMERQPSRSERHGPWTRKAGQRRLGWLGWLWACLPDRHSGTARQARIRAMRSC